jgi:hypothetical protein
MPIRFDIDPNNNECTVYHVLVLYAFAWMQWSHIFTLLNSQRSVFMFRMPNVTSVTVNLYGDIPYEDCRCSIVPIKDCLADERLKYTRTVPLILFVLVVYFIWNHLSFSGNRVDFLVKVYWIVSMFTFFAILIIIYRSSYYYNLIARILICTGHLLFGIVAYCMRVDNEMYHS